MDLLESRLGENSLNEYMSFDTPNGTGKVELSRGNFIYSQEDILLPAPQIPINISRTYNSKSDEIFSMGYGWRQAYDMYVSECGDKVYYVDDTNALYLFEKKDEKYVCNENTEITLEIDDDILSRNIEKNNKVIKTLELDVYYKISDKDDNVYRFDDCGRLVLMEESNGTFVYIEYNDKNGKINSVNTSRGQVAEYSYNENGFISKITAAPNSQQSYSYEYQYESNKLIKATFVGTNGNKIEYKYVYNNDNRLSDVIDAMGNKYSIDYDGEYISKFSYPNGEYSAFTFTKNQKQSQPVTRIKTFSDNREVCSEEYNFTLDGRITYKKDALGNTSSYSYDSMNKSLLKKETGSESYYTLEGDTVVQKSIVNSENTQYDSHGNIVKSTDIDGNVTEYTYDYSDSLTDAVKNQPKTTKVIDPDGKIIENNLNEYDRFGNVIKEVDYIKNTVTLYTYGEDGEVSSVQELLGANVNDKDFQNTAILSGSENITYNDDGDEISEDSNEGTVEEKTFNIYDDLGNVIVDITSKSEIGDELVSKLSKDNSIENIKECIKGTDYIVNKYVYDEFLRTIRTTEVSKKGAKTIENHYNDNESITESKDEKGRITKTTFDSMNRAIKTELIVGSDTKETADNPYAYFNGKTWKWVKSKKSNPRYKKAVKACAKYLKYFGNKKVKSYKLKY
jgi:YD repeat-containing protein